MLRPQDSAVTAFCLFSAYFLYRFKKLPSSPTPSPCSQGYILTNQVVHARLLPIESSHAFTYSTICLLLSLNALESHTLDLGGGFIFGYGSTLGKLVGLRPKPYLTESNGRDASIRDKLVDLLKRRGYLGNNDELEDVWMMTMPSYLGFEGINPLTVYFCYKPGGVLWLVVLEVHNTFGESHVYLLEIGKGEDDCPSNFDHRWTFPRAFHVSPFNDRNGFYTVSVKRPSHPPSASISSASPLPTVSVHLHTPSNDENKGAPGPLKLTAVIRPTHSVPLTTPNLLGTLVRYPFAFFLSLPRILYQAWILHYKKRLDVYIRPEPLPAADSWGSTNKSGSPSSLGGGVRWQPAGAFESYARDAVEKFLMDRTAESGIRVELIPGSATEMRRVFDGEARRDAAVQKQKQTLSISYLSPRFFTILLLSPSVNHALLYGSKTEGIFVVSDEALFLQVFGADESQNDISQRLSIRQRLRCIPIPASLLPNSDSGSRHTNSHSTPSSHSFIIPPKHILDKEPYTSSFGSTLVILTLLSLASLEKYIFKLVRARTVKGDEPWAAWERAAELEKIRAGDSAAFVGMRYVQAPRPVVGSVRSDV